VNAHGGVEVLIAPLLCGTERRGVVSLEQEEVSTENIMKGSIPGKAISCLVDYRICVILCGPKGSKLFLEI